MANFWWCRGKIASACRLGFFLLFAIAMRGQDDAVRPVSADDGIKPVPILTGFASCFTKVNGGQFQHTPAVAPLLLFPIGDQWLVEAKGSYSDSYAKGSEGYYEGTSSYGLSYAQLDYIANRFVTLSGGRFIAPFGIYGERLAPSWIKAFQTAPMVAAVSSGSSLGGMVRGAFPAGTSRVNFNYAAYYSAANTNHITATGRSTGGRMSLFLPGPRLEIGFSFQQLLEAADHSHVTGLHFEWQPNRVPLTLRSELVHSSGTKGEGYWVESVYRLSQISYLRRLELAARGQQFAADGNLPLALVRKLGSLGQDGNQGDVALNYYLRSDVRASASYGRQFIAGKDANLWVVGLTYRFVMPLGPTGSVQ